MNETLQKAVAVMIEKAVSGVDTAMNFLVAEIPDVIHQLLVWNLVKSVVTVVACLAVLFGIYLVVRFINKKAEESEHSDHFPTVIEGVLLGGLGGVPCVLGISHYTLNALQIWLAPKVWLIEYAAKLVK